MQPYPAALVKSIVDARKAEAADFDQAGAAARYQRDWLAESGDDGWCFPDPQRPCLRAPLPGTHPDAAAGGPWNFLVPQRQGAARGPASPLDVAPTIADLAGIRETTPWVGRSLLHPGRVTVTGSRKGRLFAESPAYSLAHVVVSARVWRAGETWACAGAPGNRGGALATGAPVAPGRTP